MSRLPLRWKVTLAFAGALVAVLSAVGAFVYLRFDAELGQMLDRSPRARASEVGAAETERLCRLADHLLVVAQADERRLPVQREPLPVAEVGERVVDRQRIEQAITNLVDNAPAARVRRRRAGRCPGRRDGPDRRPSRGSAVGPPRRAAAGPSWSWPSCRRSRRPRAARWRPVTPRRGPGPAGRSRSRWCDPDPLDARGLTGPSRCCPRGCGPARPGPGRPSGRRAAARSP